MAQTLEGEVECMNCEQTIDPDDTFSMDEDTLEHYNCPCCFQCGQLLCLDRFPVPDQGCYGSWGPVFFCPLCALKYTFKRIG